MEAARTVAVNVFVMVEMFYLFNCRCFSRSMFSVGLFTNPWLIVGAIAMVGLQLFYTYVPVMNALFQSAPIDWDAWWRILLVGLSAYVLVGAEKMVTGWMSGEGRASSGEAPASGTRAEA